MKKVNLIRLRILIAVLCCVNQAFAQTVPVEQGLYHNYSKMPSTDSFELNRLWFKDSAIIYELKADIKIEHNDSVVYRGYDVFRYRFFDIPNNTYYEYNSFTDTAAVICKYPGDEDFVAGFFSTKSKPFSIGLISLADTVINAEKLKRVKYVHQIPALNHTTEIIYFFSCAGYRSDLFGLLKEFNMIFPGCTLREKILITYDSGQTMLGSDRYEIVRPLLNSEEEKIFLRWKKNTRDKSIPMSTISDMHKIPISPVKFRNNPKYPISN